MTSVCNSAKLNEALSVRRWLLKLTLLALLRDRCVNAKPILESVSERGFIAQDSRSAVGFFKRIVRSSFGPETRMTMSEIEDPRSGLKWSSKHTSGLSPVDFIIDNRQHGWVVCQRERHVMLGLRSGENGAIRFAVRTTDGLVLSWKQYPNCEIDLNKTDHRYFKLESNANEYHVLLKHVRTEGYLQLDHATRQLNFTRKEHATPWLITNVEETS